MNLKNIENIKSIGSPVTMKCRRFCPLSALWCHGCFDGAGEHLSTENNLAFRFIAEMAEGAVGYCAHMVSAFFAIGQFHWLILPRSGSHCYYRTEFVI